MRISEGDCSEGGTDGSREEGKESVGLLADMKMDGHEV